MTIPKSQKGKSNKAKDDASSVRSKQTKLYNIYRKYLSETSLHGLKYFNVPNEKALEKAFWVVAIAVCWACGAWWSYEVFEGRLRKI